MATGPLAGRVAVVTGVSRRAGIGFAIAQRLLADGASVLVQSWAAHDAAQPWGADAAGVEPLLDELRGDGLSVAHVSADLADPAAPARVVVAVGEAFGPIDIIVANHARSSDQDLEHVTATELDLSFAVNARATVLLVQAFAAQHPASSGGRVVLFISGQHLAPMADELPYAISKGAVQQITRSLAAPLAARGITVNAVNPGPTDTGWASPELHERVRTMFPSGRWGRPDDAANLVAWLVSDEAAWITGQTIDAEGGFRRS